MAITRITDVKLQLEFNRLELINLLKFITKDVPNWLGCSVDISRHYVEFGSCYYSIKSKRFIECVAKNSDIKVDITIPKIKALIEVLEFLNSEVVLLKIEDSYLILESPSLLKLYVSVWIIEN
jgi:hypothetical protein